MHPDENRDKSPINQKGKNLTSQEKMKARKSIVRDQMLNEESKHS